ncbi:hypothetical protein [Treponema saccharophilum]|uniref:hypothetical protein n=1 Tax=Treponema saccharophilum TaxID=165 RepID=UPI0038649AB3
MKLSKKVLAAFSAVAALAVAGTFVGCADDEGDGGSSGGKYDLTFWADAREDGKTSTDAQYLYKRAFKQLGTKEQVSAFNATVTVDISKYQCKLTELTETDGTKKYYQDDDGAVTRYSNIGLMFDYHKTQNSEGKNVYDAVIIGYRPYDKGFYVEHYKDVSSESFSTEDGGAFSSATAIGEADKYITASQNGYVSTYKDQVTRDETKKTDTFTITVTQATAGTYTIKIGEKTVGTYIRTATENDDGTTLRGGLAAYGNAAVGTYAKATFTTGKENITGKLFDDVVEE